MDDHVRHVAERELAALIGARSRPGARLSDSVPHLQRVKQERLFDARSKKAVPVGSSKASVAQDRQAGRKTQADAVSKFTGRAIISSETLRQISL